MNVCNRLIGLTAAISALCSLNAQATVAGDVLALTGGKTAKVVWSRYVSGIIGDYTSVYGACIYRLMAYSTTTDQVRDVLGTTGNYYRAKITNDGSKIIYNNNHDLYMVDWSGSNNHLIMKNAAICCYWYNAASGKDYAFIARGTQNMAYWMDSDPIYRVCLSDTTDKLLIQITANGYAGIWMSASKDGTRLTGSFPWGTAGSGTWTIKPDGTGTFQSYNIYGCWSETPPDNSYRYMIYDVDSHNENAVLNADGSGHHIINLVPPLPANACQGTYNMRMSVNDPHFFTLIAPMCVNASGFDQNVGAYLGKLDDNITTVQGWVKIAGSGECMPCAWIDQGSTPVQPSLGASTAQLNFNATAGGANPALQTVTITNTGTGALSAVTAHADSAWVVPTVSTGGGNTQTIGNQVNIAALTVGTHTATITVSGGGASNSVTYKVVVTIAADVSKLTTITITPAIDSIGLKASAFLTARCLDQHNNSIKAIVTWSVSGGGKLSRALSPVADSTDTTTFTSDSTGGTFLVIASNGLVKDTARITATSALNYWITLLSPLGNKNYSVGDTMPISWNASNNMDAVVIHLSVDKGLSWATLQFDTIYTFKRASPGWGNVKWKIPATVPVIVGGGVQNVSTVSTQVLLEVRGYFLGTIYAVTPTAFSIKAATTVVFSKPNTSDAAMQIAARGERSIFVKGSVETAIQIFDLRGIRYYADRLDAANGERLIRMSTPGIFIVRTATAGTSTSTLVIVK
ncbi:MAG: hypothetical protein PHC61_11785 [Chitinivibrionales bacterium]|nr:hypothetical protein [Chitinivibrionales bacterium]